MPIMPQYRSPYGQSIAELLMRQGEIAARGAERSGQIWGNAVQNLGQIGAQAYEQHREQKDQEQRSKLFGEALSTFDPANPKEFYRKTAVALGPALATQAVRAMSSFMESQTKGPDLKLFENKAEFIKNLWTKDPELVKQQWPTLSQAVASDVAALYKVNIGAEWDDKYGPLIESFSPTAAKAQGAPERVEQNGVFYERDPKTGAWAVAQGLPEEKPEVKPPATQNIGGKVMQFNPESGRFDIPLGASEAALNREAAGAARVVAAEQKAIEDAEKKAAKAEEAAAAKRANDEQVASAFAAMKAALGEVEKYAGSSALTSPLEAANARQQYDSAAKAFAATLSRATGDTRISDNDRKAYAGLLTYTGPGRSLLMITRPDLTRKRLEEAEGFFAAASGVRGGGNASAPPPPPVSNAEKSKLLKDYGF